MTHHISPAVANLKASIRDVLAPDEIHSACRRNEYRWRERVLGPAATIWMFALQILHGNRSLHPCGSPRSRS